MEYDTFHELEAPSQGSPVYHRPIQSKKRANKILTVVALLIVVGIFAFASTSKNAPSPSLVMFDSKTDSLESSGLGLYTYNSYTKENPIDTLAWTYVAEPHRETFFEATFDSKINTDSTSFSWEIDGEVLASNQQRVSHTFKNTGLSSLKLTASQGEEQVELSATVVVKYVRREIRSLTDEDREKLLEAMEIIYRIGQEEGEALYGPDFRNMDSFSKEHLNGAGRKECDHWHDDAGIVTHHVGFTLEFEQVMQLIDPSLCLPYWEYTYDADAYDDLSDSPIFKPDWFGELDPENDDHVVSTGRWAYLKVNKVTDGFDVVNPWGLLRTPWNMDPSPYLTRNAEVNGGALFTTPDCKSFNMAFSEDTLAYMNNMLNGGTHGPVHIEIGGEWNIPQEMLDFADEIGFRYDLVLVFKILWRTGFATCPTTCVEGMECRCSPSWDAMANRGYSSRDALTKADVLKYYTGDFIYYDDGQEVYHLKGYADKPAEEMEIFDKILEGLSNPGFVGEMYTSSAPTDPTFWLIHPTAERLLNWRRLVSEWDSFDETWDYWHQSGANPSDDGWYCDWTDVEKFGGLPNCWQQTCYGHGPDDELEFNFLNIPGKVFTNQELYNYIDPLNIELPYMYDNYKWSHCEAMGESFQIDGYDSYADLLEHSDEIEYSKATGHKGNKFQN